MDAKTVIWLDLITVALADARALVACFRIDAPELVVAIESALAEANLLKNRARLS